MIFYIASEYIEDHEECFLDADSDYRVANL